MGAVDHRIEISLRMEEWGLEIMNIWTPLCAMPRGTGERIDGRCLGLWKRKRPGAYTGSRWVLLGSLGTYNMFDEVSRWLQGAYKFQQTQILLSSPSLAEYSGLLCCVLFGLYLYWVLSFAPLFLDPRRGMGSRKQSDGQSLNCGIPFLQWFFASACAIPRRDYNVSSHNNSRSGPKSGGSRLLYVLWWWCLLFKTVNATGTEARLGAHSAMAPEAHELSLNTDYLVSKASRQCLPKVGLVVTRSLRRARHRIERHGSTTYRGRQYTVSDLGRPGDPYVSQSGRSMVRSGRSNAQVRSLQAWPPKDTPPAEFSLCSNEIGFLSLNVGGLGIDF